MLRVIDYIGNHRIFLTKLRALLAAGPADRSLALKLDQIIDGMMPLSAGCSITYDLKVIEILRALLRRKTASDDLEAQYRDFPLRNGIRPTPSEIGRMGFDPARNGHGGWFDFVRDMGDPVEPRVLTAYGPLLRQIERNAALTAPALSAVVASLTDRTSAPEGLDAWTLSPFFRRDGGRPRIWCHFERGP